VGRQWKGLEGGDLKRNNSLDVMVGAAGEWAKGGGGGIKNPDSFRCGRKSEKNGGGFWRIRERSFLMDTSGNWGGLRNSHDRKGYSPEGAGGAMSPMAANEGTKKGRKNNSVCWKIMKKGVWEVGEKGGLSHENSFEKTSLRMKWLR